jgi:molecular chaperone HscB
VICWSCKKDAASDAGADAVCASCGALQPPDRGADHFAVLELAPEYAIDLAAAEEAYKRLSRQYHPDRFARADARARRASLERTVQLNDAWRTLRDPVRRAEYLIARAGVKVSSDAVAPAFLMEIMELREELAAALAARDEAKVARMSEEMRGRAAASMAAIAAALDGGQPTQAAQALATLRYYQRFLDEVAERADGDRRALAVGHG